LSPGLPRDGFEANGGQVMAFVDDEMPVVGDQIRDDTLPHHALHEGHIDIPGRLLLPAMDNAQLVRRDVQKRLETHHPLTEKLPTMVQQRSAAAIGSRGVSVPNQVRRLGNSSFVVAAGVVLRDGQLDCVQQILIANRFGQELDRTALHGPNRHRDIGVTADEHDRQAQICLGQLLLKIEPA